MTSTEIRKRFLAFFEKRGHAIIPSASLIPENDPSVLFNTAGMQPLVPYLLGEKHPLGSRLVNIQKCLRTVDFDGIGDNTHATFFEMMGNWSLGDYFKKESINWSYELLTGKEEGFGLDPQRLYVTCFEGDQNAPRDEESANIWKEIFERNNVTGERIYFMPAENNWWSAGENSPCGPDTEMFYDVTGMITGGMSKDEFIKADDEQKVVEIWNNVFMEYLKKDGVVIGKLERRNVDTGSGFERVTMVLQNKDNIYDTDIFEKVISKIDSLSSNKDIRAKRIVADHIRSATMLISDGVIPSNSDQGYVLRRILRRAVMQADKLGIPENSLFEVAKQVIEIYKDVYKNVSERSGIIINEINKEEQKFRETLARALKLIHNTGMFEKTTSGSVLSERAPKLTSEFLFELETSHGFPVDLALEEFEIRNKTLNNNGYGEPYDLSPQNKADLLKGYNDLIKEHKEKSRSGAEQKFKGGLGDTSEVSLRYHTATHLLHQALRQVLGEHVQQKGSNITADRLRFDFTHTQKMTDEEKKKVEDIVNEKIKDALPVNRIELPKEEALKTGALHFFGDKYGDIVSVYYIGDSIETAFSKEFCGGPHVSNTSELGAFKIAKEEAVSAGVRRIKAVLS